MSRKGNSKRERRREIEMAEHHKSHPDEIEKGLPDYIRALKKPGWGPYQDVLCAWMEIDQLTSGTKANRYALGCAFKKLRDIYSEKNIGGNRRTSGHGTFEMECEQRGYPARTVRGWIADYSAALSGAPTEAQKRTARTKAKVFTTQKLELTPAGRERICPPPAQKLEYSGRQIIGLYYEPKDPESGPSRKRAIKLCHAARKMATDPNLFPLSSPEKARACVEACKDRKQLALLVSDLEGMRNALNRVLPTIKAVLDATPTAERLEGLLQDIEDIAVPGRMI
jgi:hypothetical protein